MKRVKKWEDLMGKTIKHVEPVGDENIVLVFDDECYALIRSGPSYDGDRSEPELSELDAPSNWTNENDARIMAQTGIWDNDEYVRWKTLRENREKDSAAETERRERETLAKLKAKYERS